MKCFHTDTHFFEMLRDKACAAHRMEFLESFDCGTLGHQKALKIMFAPSFEFFSYYHDKTANELLETLDTTFTSIIP